MHLLYMDDAGSAGNPKEEYLILGGVSLFESQVHWITEQLNELAESICPGDPHSVEFHASEIFRRHDAPWRGMTREEAQGTIKAVLGIMRESYESARIFACAVHKASYPGKDPMELAFEDLCSRFDLYLNRRRSEGGRQRGMLIIDNNAYQTTLQEMARNFYALGTRWGGIHNLVETPLFVDSRASRAVQLADHVAYAVFRRYNALDLQYFNVIESRFDRGEDGVMHGLSHKTADRNCTCPACFSRQLRA